MVEAAGGSWNSECNHADLHGASGPLEGHDAGTPCALKGHGAQDN